MTIWMQGHDYRYAVEQIQLSLFPDESTGATTEQPAHADVVSALHRGRTYLTAVTTIEHGGRTATARLRCKADGATDSNIRGLLQRSYYKAAVQLLPSPPAWGAISGVRPTKLSTRYLLAGGTRAGADRLLREQYFVTPARRRLCLDCSEATVDALSKMRPDDLSLYLGVPFCPTRCSYCSFVSISTQQLGHLVAPFHEKLLEEIAVTGELARASGRRIRTVYLGGGTPTVFTAEQLARVFDALNRHFDLSDSLECTVEGGRPDTLDAEKLAVLRNGGCDRISVNPQTMSDSVLARVGRRHTAADVVRSYEQARAAGFDAINMDLIAGLPGDTPDSFARSLDQAIDLSPENLTVHTLALKKGAALYSSRADLPTAADVAEMLAYAAPRLQEAGYAPYYLYRQKYMSGSFENVGWTKPGKACLYNIYMMEELHSIVALGGGGMSKVNLPGGALRRFHNPKYPQEYLSQFDGVLAQKRELFNLLANARCESCQPTTCKG